MLVFDLRFRLRPVLYLHSCATPSVMLKINCKLSQLDEKLLDFAKKNNLKKNIFKDFKSIQNLKKLKQDINKPNFGRD